MKGFRCLVARRPFNSGWRRLIGSPKLQIIFHKRATKYRALLLKMTCKDKGSYGSSPPCTLYGWVVSTHLFVCAYIFMDESCQKYIRMCHIYMWDAPHPYMGHDAWMCGTRRVHVWDMTHSYVGHDVFICLRHHIHMWDMTHSYV